MIIGDKHRNVTNVIRKQMSFATNVISGNYHNGTSIICANIISDKHHKATKFIRGQLTNILSKMSEVTNIIRRHNS